MTRVRGTGSAGVLLVALTAALSALPVAAEVPSAPGIKVGSGRLHPFLRIDGRFDSLVGYFQVLNGVAQPSPEIVLGVRPGLRFDVDTASTLVAFDGSAEYLWYTGALSPSSTRLSRLQADVGLDAHLNRDGAVEVQLGDRLTRSDRTQNPAAGVGVISLFNNARLALPIHPGGRALEITPSVAFGLELFDPLLTGSIAGCTVGDATCDPNAVSQMNYGNLQAGLSGRWKFLPKTAVVLDANYDYRIYFNGAAANLPGKVLRVQAGLVGLVSPRIAVTLLAGYGGNLAQSPLTSERGPHTPIGQAEVAFIPSDKSRLAVGYLRTIQPVSMMGTFIDDRGYLEGKLGLWGGRLVLSANVAADFFGYRQPVARDDTFLSATAGPRVIVTSWLDVAASYRLSLRDSSATAQSLNYLRHEALLSLDVHY